MALIKKIILDIENPTRSQIKNALNAHKIAEKRRTKAGLHLLNEIRTCGGCGKENFIKAAMYYGEIFCADCVEKWTQPKETTDAKIDMSLWGIKK